MPMYDRFKACPYCEHTAQLYVAIALMTGLPRDPQWLCQSMQCGRLSPIVVDDLLLKLTSNQERNS